MSTQAQAPKSSPSPQAEAASRVQNMSADQLGRTLDAATERSDHTPLHPASGLVILGLDWILFSGTVISLGTLAPLFCMLGFLIGGCVVFLIQSRLSSDDSGRALAKGVIGGLLVGIPTPIVGTVAGFAVLAVSGLHRLLK